MWFPGIRVLPSKHLLLLRSHAYCGSLRLLMDFMRLASSATPLQATPPRATPLPGAPLPLALKAFLEAVADNAGSQGSLFPPESAVLLSP